MTALDALKVAVRYHTDFGKGPIPAELIVSVLTANGFEIVRKNV